MTLILHRPSPNWNARPAGMEIDTILLHATQDRDTATSVQYLTDRASKVSYHNLVDRDASLYNLVAPEHRAWHAGGSIFLGRTNVNDFSLGLSFANLNDGRERYPDVQLAVGAQLCAGWMKRFPRITIDRITTHAIVRAAWREHHPDAEVKTDPMAPAFDLDAFKLRVLRELTGGGGCI